MRDTIRSLVDGQAAAGPGRVWLVAPETGRELTYARLRESSLALASFLADRGIGAGERVATFMGNGLQTARLFIGVMYAGRVVTPLNLLAQASQLEYVLAHCDARLVFVAPGERERLAAAAARAGRPIELVSVDPDCDEFIAAAPAGADRLAPSACGDDALMMYTSGTTGVPKGVVLTHANVIAGGSFVTQAHALGEGDRVLAVLPLYHINGQIVTAAATLVHGGSVVMPHRFSAGEFWSLACRHRCTWLNVVPTIVSYLLAGPDPRAAGLDLSRIRFCRSASAPLPPELHRAFEERFGIGIIETMGLTETAAPVFTNPLDPAKRRIGSPGQAFGNEAKVVDPGTGRDLPAGEPGEIMIRGANVMKAYYKSPEATAKALEPDGWLHTGDLGLCDRDGFYFITGRLKELIIKGGENIAPREIDEALYRHPAVLEAAAVGIPDPHYGQEILAAVVVKPGMSLTEDELRAFCEAELGRYKMPKVIRFMRELPKGPSGKVQRLKLLES
ncbi:MAG: AMP-binding protein [Betaproteobacteria bacterium]|nr:AMP-binding protein [Betaproteobacteria bacterium]MDE2358116.1 AMP-binding protein [Betaproteobacteria bacterium]